VVEHYREKEILVEIDGEQPIEPITQEILKALGKN
jgi:adenylate kinase family enzyme